MDEVVRFCKWIDNTSLSSLSCPSHNYTSQFQSVPNFIKKINGKMNFANIKIEFQNENYTIICFEMSINHKEAANSKLF